MVTRFSRTRRAPAALLAVTLGAGVLALAGEAGAAVTSVTGSAYGYRAFNVALFGGSQPDTGPIPTVTLASDASNSPQSARAETGLVKYGPATLFTSDAIDVTSAGTLGVNGSVTSSVSIRNVNKAVTQPSTGTEIFTADNVTGTCTASESGKSGSTTIVNGILQIDSGLDLNDDGDFTDSGEHPPVNQPIPASPAPNTAYEGHIHLDATSYDSFRVVFNEQIAAADGSLTVNPVHEYFLGPVLTGQLILGQTVCGVNVDQTVPTIPTPTTPSTTSITTPPTTIPAPPIGASQFCNDVPILSYPQPFIPPPGRPDPNPSTPYPSSIDISGLTGTITDVNVTLRGFQTRSQTWPEDTDVLLAAPNGANVILMADAGGDNDNSNGSLSDVHLTLDDEAATQLPADTRLSTGTYRPVDDDVDRGGDTQPDTWLEPAPPLTDTTLLSTFDGLNPNGRWDLYVIDDQWLAENDFVGGWCIDITTTTSNPPQGDVVADFDGDGASDVSVFRPADGTWYLQGSPQANFGASGDIAVPADYDGDGKSDVAVFRPSDGVWYVKGSAGTDTAVAFGSSGDIPVPADYDGDGKADRAVFRSGVWHVKGSAGTDTAVAFGANGDVPVPADYDGDGKVDRAVFRSGVWYVNGSAGTDTAIAFGTAGDVPLPGDYDGDGTADIAVFRPSTGVWFIQGGTATAWGTDGDIPVPGDYDGDGALEIAGFRPSNGVWFVQGGPTTAWGATGDVPLPLPAAVYRSMG